MNSRTTKNHDSSEETRPTLTSRAKDLLLRMSLEKTRPKSRATKRHRGLFVRRDTPYPHLEGQGFTFENVFREDTSEVSDYEEIPRQASPEEEQEFQEIDLEFQQGVPWEHEDNPSVNTNSQHEEPAIDTANLTNPYSPRKNVPENIILVKRHDFRFDNVQYRCMVLTPLGEITKPLSEQEASLCIGGTEAIRNYWDRLGWRHTRKADILKVLVKVGPQANRRL